ncbi:MAG: isochorismatase family protein [Micrococcales bacterium]|nr:isochorismatase family protein [Micrococcales bacterium]
MTTQENRSHTALLVVDVQRDVVGDAYHRDEVVANIASLVGRARAQHVAVVWVRHFSEQMPAGSDGWQIVPELVPAPDESIVEKAYGDAFEDTALESVLGGLGVGRLVVAGAQTDACIRATIHGAFARGYDVTLVADAHTTSDWSAYGAPTADLVIAHTNLYWGFQLAPGRKAGVTTTAEATFGPAV